MKNKDKPKDLAISQKQKLEEWQKKLENGEAYKETKEIIMNSARRGYEPEANIKKIAKDIIPKYSIKREELTEDESQLFSKAGIDLGFDNDLSIIEAIDERYRNMMMGFKREMIKEFDCRTYSEKALVDMAVCAYSRNLNFSKKLQFLNPQHYSNEVNGYITALSKEVDKANRHFITAIEMLKQLKQPELKVNVKTKTAFISQNQQFNNNQNDQDESIKNK